MRKVWISCMLLVSFLLIFSLSGCSEDEDQKKGHVSAKDLTAAFLNVGAADALVLIQDGHCVVIDAGTAESAPIVLAYLEDKKVEKIDMLILTHYDQDHIGGVPQIMEKYEVGIVYGTYPENKPSTDTIKLLEALQKQNLLINEVREITEVTVSDTAYTIYPPEDRTYTKDASNNSSLVIMAASGDHRILVAGDAEKARLRELLKLKGLDADILKMPHHGRNEDNLEKFVLMTSPDYAVITSSETEKEDKKVVNMLEKHGIETILTREGGVEFLLSDSGITRKDIH